jgi:hypothetical protein
MKPNRASHVFWRMRIVVVSLAFAVVAVLEFRVSKSAAARITQISTRLMAGPQAPPTSLADVMAAAR